MRLRTVVVAPGDGRPVAALTAVVTRGATLHLASRARYGTAVVLALVALAAFDLTQDVLPGGGAFLLLLIPVMLGAVALGIGPALTTLLLGAIGSLLLVALRGHPWLSAPLDSTRLVLYLAEGGFAVAVGAVLREVARANASRSPAAGAAAGRLIEPLTDRELEVLRLAAGGLSVEAIGRRIYLSRNTVKSHLAHAYGKLGAHNRAEAIAAGLHWGCLERSALAPPAPGAGLPERGRHDRPRQGAALGSDGSGLAT